MTSFVTGATGFIGSTLVEYLVRQLEMTKVLFRKGSNIKLIDELAVEAVEGDLSNVQLLKDAIGDADVVYNAAAETKPSLTFEQYAAVNVTGFRNLLEASLQTGVKRVIHLSTIEVYGFNLPDQPVDEDYPFRPNYSYQRSKAEAEKIALDYMQNHPELGLTIVRPAVAFGPRDRAFSARLIEMIRSGKVSLPSGGRNPMSLIYTKDVAKALHLASTNEKSAGRIYNVKGFDSTPRELIGGLSHEMGSEINVSSVPFSIAYVVALARETASRMRGDEPRITRFALDYIGKTRLLNDERIREELGYRPDYDLTHGCKETIDWYREKIWRS